MILCEPPARHNCTLPDPCRFRLGTVAVCDGCGKHWVVEDSDGWGGPCWRKVHTKWGLKRLLKKAGCGSETS